MTVNATTADVADLFVTNTFRLIRLHVMPRDIVSDRDPRFAEIMPHICKLVSTKQCKSSAFHPETDGQTEHMNRVLEDMLRHYISPAMADWDKHLPLAEFAVNNAWQESIHNTPCNVVYGISPLTPAQMACPDRNAKPAAAWLPDRQHIVSETRRHMHNARNRQKHFADRKRSHVKFAVNDKVFLNAANLPVKGMLSRKLFWKWMGPFTVTEVINPVPYRLELPSYWQLHDVFHVNLLKAVP